jgi:hypothetical protein
VLNTPKVINGRLFIKRIFYQKKKAMSYEYILKHDRKERLKIYNNYK